MAKTLAKTLPGFMELMPQDQILFEKMKKMGEAALEVVHENQGATERNIASFEELVKEYGIKLRKNA
jgi:hypothetical protein